MFSVPFTQHMWTTNPFVPSFVCLFVCSIHAISIDCCIGGAFPAHSLLACSATFHTFIHSFIHQRNVVDCVVCTRTMPCSAHASQTSSSCAPPDGVTTNLAPNCTSKGANAKFVCVLYCFGITWWAKSMLSRPGNGFSEATQTPRNRPNHSRRSICKTINQPINKIICSSDLFTRLFANRPAWARAPLRWSSCSSGVHSLPYVHPFAADCQQMVVVVFAGAACNDLCHRNRHPSLMMMMMRTRVRLLHVVGPNDDNHIAHIRHFHHDIPPLLLFVVFRKK